MTREELKVIIDNNNKWLNSEEINDTEYISLQGKDFIGMDLSGFTFNSMDLSGVRFYRCNLNKTIFNCCNLSNADFSCSTIVGSRFVHCKMHRTSFFNARIVGTEFTRSVGSAINFNGSITKNVDIDTTSILYCYIRKDTYCHRVV